MMASTGTITDLNRGSGIVTPDNGGHSEPKKETNMTDPNNRDALNNTPASAETLNRLKEHGSGDQPRQPVATSFGSKDRNLELVAKIPSKMAGK
jgi:hypothetical protein